jgi:hypothetical protein
MTPAGSSWLSHEAAVRNGDHPEKSCSHWTSAATDAPRGDDGKITMTPFNAFQP